jgi:hypothetical protein
VSEQAKKSVSNLSIGDQIEAKGFDGVRAVVGARRLVVGKNTTSKFDLDLRDEAGEVEKARFDMNEEVTVVGHQDFARKDGGVKLKPGKKAPKATQAPKPTLAPKPIPAPKDTKKPKADAGDKKMSALDAAAKLLAETGEPMNCQDLIKGMADKGYWTSPGGLTPAATLYSAILRELKTKGTEARFRKIEKGRFAATRSA